MTYIETQHMQAFRDVTAYVILRDGKPVASVAFKHPGHGTGRTSCFLSIPGWPMTKGSVSGLGYDTYTAAARLAFRDIAAGGAACGDETVTALKAAIKNSTEGWKQALEDSGFVVVQAV